MSAAAPASESVDLLNRLFLLSYDDDQVEIGQIKWRLDALVRKDNVDDVALFAWGLASVLSKKRDDARLAVERLYGRRQGLEYPVFVNFIAISVDLGMYELAFEALVERAENMGALPSDMRPYLWRASMASGHLEWMSQLADADMVDAENDARQLLEKNNLLEHFKTHQQIVEKELKSVQVGISVTYSQDDGGESLFFNYGVPFSRKERHDIEKIIRYKLGAYYESVGLHPNCYIGILSLTMSNSYTMTVVG